MSEPVGVVPDISVAYVVVVGVVVVVVVVVVISLGTMVQFPVQEVKTQLAELAINKKRRTKQLHIQKEDGGREEKRRGKQSSRTSEHAITGRVATAKGKRGGAIWVHSILSQWSIQTGTDIFNFGSDAMRC